VNINLTKKEYRLLLELIYLGDWMIHAHEEEISEDTADYKMLVQKIYSFAKDMESEDLIEVSRRWNEYFPTRKLEEESRVFEFIQDYDDATFWRELEERLVERDLRDDLGAEALRALKPEEFDSRAEPISRDYWDEFTTFGIDRLRIVENLDEVDDESGDA